MSFDASQKRKRRKNEFLIGMLVLLLVIALLVWIF
jgi:hypothetical protein